MAKLEEKKVVTKTVTFTGLDRQVPEDPAIHKAIGVAAHYVLERFDFNKDDAGEMFIHDLLKDVKSATGVRAPRTLRDDAGPQLIQEASKKKVSKKKASKKKTAASNSEEPRSTGHQDEELEEEPFLPEEGPEDDPTEPDSEEVPADSEPASALDPGPKLADPFESSSAD